MSEPSRRKTLSETLRLVVTSWKAAVGFLAGLGVILGFAFHPPWDRGSSSSASDTKTATQSCPGISKGRISNVSTDPPIRLNAYWELHPGSRETKVSKSRLNSLGRVVHFRVDLNGYRGKDLTVWWWMLTPNGAPLPEPTLRRQLAFGMTPHDCTTGGSREIWAELPERKGTFRVEIQLVDPGGEQLDFARTEPFAVTEPRS
jgi:hypothetical protein